MGSIRRSIRPLRSHADRETVHARTSEARTHHDHQPHTLLGLQRTIGNRGVQRVHAPARVVQRQPDTSDAGPIGNPMEFIEAQLARRFVDPDDPRLAVRVRRLQEAVTHLTMQEAKQVLGRLREPANALAQNFQRLATPSRQKLLRGLRGRLPSDIEGKRLGTLNTGTGPMATSTPLTAAAEIVPSTEEPGSFAGYEDEAAARRTAVRRPTISAIVKDKRIGLHRVFETGVPTVRQGSLTISANETGVDYELTDWVNVEGSPLPDPGDRAARAKHADELRAAFIKTYERRMSGDDPARDADLAKVRNAYEALVVEALPFASGEINVSMELNYVDPAGKLHRATTAASSMINIDITGLYVGGFQTALDPMSEIQALRGAHVRATVQDLFTDRPPFPYEPYLALTKTSISDDPLDTRSTLLHEEAHLAHARRTIELYELWTTSVSGLSFDDWVRREAAARRLSAVDAALAIEAAGPRTYGILPNTELLAEVEGFMAGFHAASVQNRSRYFDRLWIMGNRWSLSDQVVRELAIRKFRYYYEHTLHPPERQVFDEFVLNELVNGKQPPEFYVELVKFSEGA
jgi:hypothetical protein